MTKYKRLIALHAIGAKFFRGYGWAITRKGAENISGSHIMLGRESRDAYGNCVKFGLIKLDLK